MPRQCHSDELVYSCDIVTSVSLVTMASPTLSPERHNQAKDRASDFVNCLGFSSRTHTTYTESRLAPRLAGLQGTPPKSQTLQALFCSVEMLQNFGLVPHFRSLQSWISFSSARRTMFTSMQGSCVNDPSKQEVLV